MTKYCSSCTKTGRFGERVEMDKMGSHRENREKVTIYQCPVCDTVKAVTKHRNGYSTTRTMTPEEVSDLSTYEGGLLFLGLVAAGLVLLAASGGSGSK